MTWCPEGIHQQLGIIDDHRLKEVWLLPICGDYKFSVNPNMDMEKYALPRPQDVFDILTGGQHFIKLDLSSSYLQLAVALWV